MSKQTFQRFSDRFFQVSPLYTVPGWYTKLREGGVVGPFISKEAAELALLNLIGVDPEASKSLSDETVQNGANYSLDSRRN